jgi:hypothetical protein
MGFCDCKSDYGPKTSYATKYAADKAAQEYKLTNREDPKRELMTGYECPEGNGFHIGHSWSADSQPRPRQPLETVAARAPVPVKQEVPRASAPGQGASGGGCFVATAAYGDPNHPDVVFLREFRDNTLSQIRLGRSFIKIYRRFGPALAGLVMNRRTLRRASRSLVAGIVAGLRRFVN